MKPSQVLDKAAEVTELLIDRLSFAVEILQEAEARLGYAPGSLGQIEIEEAIETGRAAVEKAGAASRAREEGQ